MHGIRHREMLRDCRQYAIPGLETCRTWPSLMKHDLEQSDEFHPCILWYNSRYTIVANDRRNMLTVASKHKQASPRPMVTSWRCQCNFPAKSAELCFSITVPRHPIVARVFFRYRVGRSTQHRFHWSTCLIVGLQQWLAV